MKNETKVIAVVNQKGGVGKTTTTWNVGIVVGWDGNNITIQEGNLDGETNSFEDAISDWRTVTYDLDTFVNVCKGVVFANNKEFNLHL